MSDNRLSSILMVFGSDNDRKYTSFEILKKHWIFYERRDNKASWSEKRQGDNQGNMWKVMAISKMFVSKKKKFYIERLCKYKNKWMVKKLDAKNNEKK